ncbi:YccF domain-containing protein [Actinomycetaceae bacterium MB13-C1-2]|nr:YccF domain-containing protein [Actinomycetaceae bacterium MB13-C1-2]
MKTLLNIIWVIFAGWELFLAYVFAGVIACIFIVTIPVGVASFRIAGYIIWPFGREVVKQPGAGVGSSLMNGLWFIIAGWWLALGHIITGIGLAITIIGIPLAVANFKLIPVTCFPYGKMVVDEPRAAAFPG